MSIDLHWDKEDVFKVRPDLTDSEAIKVLQECYFQHSKEMGMSYQLVKQIAEEIFPETRKRELKTYRVGVGRRIVQKIIVEMEGYCENEVEADVLRLIRNEEFREKPFTTTAITGEFITDIHEKKIN